MASEDFFDRSEFVQYFRDETEELLQSIDADLLRLEQFVDTGSMDAEIVNSLFRALHTVKGSAGMLDFGAVQQVAHKLENIFDLLRKDHMPLTQHGVNLLFEGRDVLTALVRAAVADGEEPVGVEGYVERLDAFAGVYDSTAQAIEGPRGDDTDEDLNPVDEGAVSAFEAEVARLLAQAAAPPQAQAPGIDVDAAQAAVDALFGPASETAEPAPFAAAFAPATPSPSPPSRRRAQPPRRRPPSPPPIPNARRRRRTRRSGSTSSGSTCCSTSSASSSSTARASRTSPPRWAANWGRPVAARTFRRLPRTCRNRRRCSRGRPTRSKRAS